MGDARDWTMQWFWGTRPARKAGSSYVVLTSRSPFSASRRKLLDPVVLCHHPAPNAAETAVDSYSS